MSALTGNWNSVTNTCGGFTVLRRKFRHFITTCFHNWHYDRLPTAADYYHQQQPHRHHHHNQQHTAILLQSSKQNSYDSYSASGVSRDFAILQQNSTKNWQHVLRELSGRHSNVANSWLLSPAAIARAPATVTANQAAEGCATIAAKLLSSTPIAATTTTQTAQHVEQIKSKKKSEDAQLLYGNGNDSGDRNMTILEDTFTQVRDEYPDLDVEIRAILLARAQDGATISDIKSDYRKNTGMHFPIYENITNFLLTIPMVAAICNERGTLYFNIVPNNKTKHLFDLVREQKPQQQYVTAPRNWRYNDYAKDINNNNNYNNDVHNNYYNNKNCNTNLNTECYSSQKDNNNVQLPQLEQLEQQQQLHHHQVQNVKQQDTQLVIQQQMQQQQLHVHVQTPYVQQSEQQPLSLQKDTEVNTWQNNYDKNANYYLDNCNHLYSRLCYQQIPQTPLSSMPANKLNVFQYDKYNNNIQKDSYWQNHNEQQPPSQQQQQQQRQPQEQNENRGNEKNALVPATDKDNFNVIEYEPTMKRKRHNTPKMWPINGGGGAVVVGGNNDDGNSENCSVDRYTNTSCTRRSQWNDSCYISCASEYEARLYDFPFLGDDFLLYLARMELNCKFKKNESVYQAGLCVSGQTIRAATKRIRRLAYHKHRIIVNIGSVDIMRGRTLLQIEHDYRELINTMIKKGLEPILTTLAPLANYMHVNDMRRTWERFNDFIKRENHCLLVIDIWSCLVNDRGVTLFDCYQKGPRNVTGAKEPYVFWNKIGRQRVLQKIMLAIEY